jgi:hypothetical protein
MSRIEWSRLSGDEVEHLIAILLCRRNPRAVQVRPSQGDGGVDLQVPRGDGREDIYQVKKFAQNLSAAQKAQILKSYKRLVQRAEDEHWKVGQWNITMPLNPTPENLTWLREETADAPFDVEWRGLNFVDGLAAEYPDVIDYYVRDGKERLNAALSDLVKLLGVTRETDGAAILTPGQVVEQLQALQPALDTDPHFRYALHLDPHRPDIPDEPGLVAAVQYGHVDESAGGHVTVKSYERFAEAVNVRPVPLRFEIATEPGSQLALDLDRFRKYGTPLHAPMGTVNGTIELPGSLGGTLDGGALTVGPAAGEGYTIRVAVVDEDRALLEAVTLDMQPLSVGVERTGTRAYGTERNGVFDLELLTDLETQKVNLALTAKDVVGRHPSAVLPGLRFLAEFRHPHGATFAQPFGPIKGEPIRISTEFARSGPLVEPALIAVVESLDVIQASTEVEIRVPRFSDMTTAEIAAIVRTARLLRGDALELTTRAIATCMPKGVSAPEGLFQIAFPHELSVKIGSIEVSVGRQIVHCARVEVAPGSARPHDDHVDITLESVDDTPFTVTWAGVP